MDTATQDTLFFFDRHQAVYPLYECFQKNCLPDYPKAESKYKNLKSHTTIDIFMPVYPS